MGVDQAKLQDREYERYVRESLSRLRSSQRTLSASSLIIRESSGTGSNGDRSDTSSVSGGSVNFPDKLGTTERDHVLWDSLIIVSIIYILHCSQNYIMISL